MFTQKLSAQLRTAITALLLTSATQQSVQALPDALRFRQPASIANYVQLATAALTLPADIISISHPDDNRLNFINHGLKLVNEALAVWQQHSPYNAGWACFDTAQGARALAALLTTAPAELINQTDEAEAVDAPIDSNQWQTFVRYANYVLASAEAATRMIAALESDNPTFAALGDSLARKLIGSMAQRSEFNHSLTSLIRLTRYCLQAPDKKQMAVLLVLFIANVVTTGWQYRQTAASNTNPRGNPLTTNQTFEARLQQMQALRPLGQGPYLPPQNLDADADYRTCEELYVQDQNKPTICGGSYSLTNWCQDHGIEPFRPTPLRAIHERRPLHAATPLNEHDLLTCLNTFTEEFGRNNERFFNNSTEFEVDFDHFCQRNQINPFFRLQNNQEPRANDAEAVRLHQLFTDLWRAERQHIDATNRYDQSLFEKQPTAIRTLNIRLAFCNRFEQLLLHHPAPGNEAAAQAVLQNRNAQLETIRAHRPLGTPPKGNYMSIWNEQLQQDQDYQACIELIKHDPDHPIWQGDPSWGPNNDPVDHWCETHGIEPFTRPGMNPRPEGAL